MSTKRQLAAIMFTDIVGYTRLMGENEVKAMELLRKNRSLHKSIIKKHRGKWLKEMGDGTLASFTTITDAVYCAGELQKRSAENDIQLKIGIHQGEIIEEAGDIFGDGVNIASRIEPLASPGQILTSEPIHQNIKNKPGITSTFLEEAELKNVDEPIKIYSLSVDVKFENEKSEKSLPSKKVVITIAGLALMLLIGYGLFNYLPFNSSDDIEKTIAVLPFRNDSPNEENVYFCNGIMEGVLDHLAQIPEFTVVSRGSVERYRKTSTPTPEIASELNVNYIVEGSVLRIGDRVKITAQLIYAPEDKHLWSGQFDKKIENAEAIFDVLANVTQNIGRELEARISPELQERMAFVPTSNLVAYDYFLRGKDHFYNWFRTSDKSSLNSANRLFDLAIEQDSLFGLAYAGKAAVYGQSFNVENYLDSVLTYSDKAISLDPNAAFAYVIRGGTYYLMGVKDMQKAGRDLHKAYELNPNDDFIVRYLAIYYALNEEYIKAFEYFKKAEKVGLDSLGKAATYFHLGYKVYLAIGDMQKALYFINKSSEMNPPWKGNDDWFNLVNGKNQEEIEKRKKANKDYGHIFTYMRGMSDSAVYYLEQNEVDKKAAQGKNYNAEAAPFRYGIALTAVDREEEGMAIINYHLHDSEQQINTGLETRQTLMKIAAILSFLGETEEAIDYLQRLDENYTWSSMIYVLQVDPLFDNLRENDEFQEIIRNRLEMNRNVREEIARLEATG